MRRLLSLIIVVICVISFCACSQANKNEVANNEVVNSWDCTVICAEESSENAYVITYSEEKVVSATGVLTLENRSDFGMAVYLQVDDGQSVEYIKAGGAIILYEMVQGAEYTIGCHAEVAEGTEIKLLVYDGAGNITGKKASNKQAITPQEAIKVAQDTFDEKSKKTVTNFDDPKIVGIVFEENMYISIPPGSQNNFRTKKLVGKELYRITFNTEQDGLLGPIVIYVDKYNGDIVGSSSRG